MPFDATSTSTSLAEIARADMERTFSEGSHRPSPNQWAAIMDYLGTVEMLASKSVITEADRVLYLSAIPAGTGKTVAVAAITRAIASSAAHEDVGVLIAVNRITEAVEMAETLGSHKAKLCVVSGRKSAPQFAKLQGHTSANGAQVVITTQAALKEILRRTRDRDFEQAPGYFYRGQRRRVILHDEQIAFNRPVVLDSDTAVNLAKVMGRQSRDAASALKSWCGEIDRLPRGIYPVPDFRGMGVDFEQLEDADEDIAAQARALSILSGEQAYVHPSSLSSSLVTHVPELPKTLLPAVVTDASAARGVHHASYDQMAETMTIVHLAEATKTYNNLTIKRVNTRASRSTYKDRKSTEGLELIEMIVRYIKQCSPHPVLVLTYKGRMWMKDVEERTIEEAITARLTDEADQARTSFLAYGRHTSTNDFKHIGHMIFAGLNFLPAAAPYAASGAALGKSMKTIDQRDHPTALQVLDMERGMLRDSTMQAVLRGAARTGVGGDCARQEVVIPAYPQKGLNDADYYQMFPGCTVVQDLSLRPLPKLKGNPKHIFDVIMTYQAEEKTEIDGASIYKTLKMSETVYGKTKGNDVLLAWLANNLWFPQRLKGNRRGFRRSPK